MAKYGKVTPDGREAQSWLVSGDPSESFRVLLVFELQKIEGNCCLGQEQVDSDILEMFTEFQLTNQHCAERWPSHTTPQ